MDRLRKPGWKTESDESAPARSRSHSARLSAKARQLAAPEKQRPLAAYRAAELAIMSRNFFDPREPYAELRRAFVYKEKPSHTPPHLARHRSHPSPLVPSSPRRAKAVAATTTVTSPEHGAAERVITSDRPVAPLEAGREQTARPAGH